ncbi:MAG: hypothetical protein WDM94_04800 [Bauldia sp.]
MTDFYALLKQSILDRGIRSAGDREEVYAQARRAVIKQLWDFRPPLAADEIDMRVGAYDKAVERIEADLRVTFASSAPPPKPSRAVVPAKPARKVALEAVRMATYAPSARGQSSAALAEWAREQPEYAPGVQRAAAYQPPPPMEEAANDDYFEDVAYEEETRPAPARRRGEADRWSEPRRTEPRRITPAFPPLNAASYLSWLGTPEQIVPRLLAIAIGALFILLVGVGAFMLGAHSRQGVTVDIGVRREVSDAATAARIPQDNVKVAQSYAVFDGRDPTVFSTTPDNPVRFDNTDKFARVSSSTSAAGVKVMIGPGLAARLAGHNVRVVIDARSSTDFGAANMRFAYQSGLAISHWQTANLGADYQSLGLLWRVPTMRTASTGDFLLIEPGIPGDGTGADIQSIRIDVLAS